MTPLRRLVHGIGFVLLVLSGGCGIQRLPPATDRQVTAAARECGLARWERAELIPFDGELEYPAEKGVVFNFDATGVDRTAFLRIGDEVEKIETCLRERLAAQGVGADISGSVSQDFQDGE
jgi:hypothetical protein